MDEVGLGKRLQDARRGAGLTQQDLCHRAGLSYSTLAKIERGAIKSPSVFTIRSIAEALGSDLNSLLGGSGKWQSPSGVRFIYFDVNGCLVRFYHRAFTQLARDCGESADVVETTFWHYNDAVCRGDMPLSEFNRQLGQRLGLEELDWQHYYMEALEPVKEMHELATWVANHYEVGLLTNIMPGFVDYMLAQGLLPKLTYRAIVDSSVVGAIKPEDKIYEVATARSGVAAGEILLVDDSRTNLMAAERRGWRVLWFDEMHADESASRLRQALTPVDQPEADSPAVR